MHICRNLCRDVHAQAGLEPGQPMKRTTMCIRAEIPQPNIALNIEIYCWSCGACWFSRFKSGRNHFSLFCPFPHLTQHKIKFLLFPFCVQRGGHWSGRWWTTWGRRKTCHNLHTLTGRQTDRTFQSKPAPSSWFHLCLTLSALLLFPLLFLSYDKNAGFVFSLICNYKRKEL